MDAATLFGCTVGNWLESLPKHERRVREPAAHAASRVYPYLSMRQLAKLFGARQQAPGPVNPRRERAVVCVLYSSWHVAAGTPIAELRSGGADALQQDTVMLI